MKPNLVWPFLLLPLLTACGSLTGLDGSSNHYGCGAPQGVTCMRMTDVYAASANTTPPASMLPATPSSRASSGSETPLPLKPGLREGDAVDGTPLRIGPRVVRMWVAPFEDSDGDLVDESRLYLQVDAGRWTIEHQRHVIESAYAPLKAPAGAGETPAKADDTTSVPVAPTPGSGSSFWQKVMPAINAAGAALPNLTLPGAKP